MPVERLITHDSMRRPDALRVCTRPLALAAALIVSLTPLAASAQTAPPKDPEAARRALEDKKSELNATKDKAQVIQSTVDDLDAERERLNGRLVETAALIQRSEGQLTAIEGRMQELEAQEKLVRGSLGQRHGQIATLLGALQRMGRNPPPVLITRREDALKMVRSAMLLSSAFPELRGQALKLGEQLGDLVRVMGDIRSEGQRLQAETDQLNEASKRLAGLMEAKKLSISERQSELQTVRAATAEISKNVDDLSQLIAQLDKNPTLANQTGLGAYEKEMKSDPPAVAPAAFDDGCDDFDCDGGRGRTVAPAAVDDQKETAVALLQPPRLKPPIVELAPSGSPLAPGNHRPDEAGNPVRAGAWQIAAAGAGPPRTQFRRSAPNMADNPRVSCWKRATAARSCRRADGWIVYAGEFRSYGQLLIINAGGGYHILLAGLSRIDVAVGTIRARRRAGWRYGRRCESHAGSTRNTTRPSYISSSARMGGPSTLTPGGRMPAKGARLMRKSDFAFWTFLAMAGLAGATTVLNVTRTYSATPTQNSEIYRQLDLFGDVLERVRADYVEKPDDTQLIEDGHQRHAVVA